MADNTFEEWIIWQENTLEVKFEARKVSWFMTGGDNL